ncbi:MAG: PQQ-dependent sugar dehydrogenase [Sphingobacteriaceae bacterium]
MEHYATNLQHPRWIYVAPDGNIFVAESDANQITLLRDNNKDGQPETREIYLNGLNKPLGMLVVGSTFYLDNTDGLWAYPYHLNQTKITAARKKILDLPAGGYNNHWTRNIIANDAGTKIYISVGSGSNAGENGMDNEKRRANILEINTDGSGEKVYGYGIRNPVGMAWAPGTTTLWTAVNERDELGDDLVPDYLTSVKEGGFYGWPYSYFGQHKDPRLKDARPDLVAKAIVPDVALGAHTASLGLAFYNGSTFPEKYHNGAFVGQHGSWNRSKLAGYKVIFVPFAGGKPNGKPEDFLTGFIANPNENDVYGRPVGIAVAPDGALLVADDSGNIIWRITSK